MKKSAFYLLLVMAIMTFATAAPASVPRLVSYQGTVTGPSGPIDGSYNLSFAIYADSIGGPALWTETHAAVPVTFGLFNVILGRFTPLPDDLFSAVPRWIGVTIGTDHEIAPRMRMTSVPWAMRAALAESSLVSAPDGDWAFSGANIYRMTGMVGIGTSTPAFKLDARDASGDAYLHVAGQGDGKSGLMLAKGAAYCRYDEAAPELRLWNAVTGGNAGDIAFGTNNVERMRIKADGSIGIGTSTPDYDVDIRRASGNMAVNIKGQDDMSSYLLLSDGAGYLRYYEQDGELQIWNTAPQMVGGDLSFATADLERMRIKANGDVGVGLANPAEKLDVAGTVKMTGFKMPTGATNGYVLTSDASGTGTWQAASGTADNDWVISGTNMYSGVSGNVGIGITTPASKLYVKTTSGTGVIGISNDGPGVYGKDESTGSYGYLGYDTVGVYGFTDEATRPAVFGYGGGLNGYGVKGVHGATQNFGVLGHSSAGVLARVFNAAHTAVIGYYLSNIGSLGTGAAGAKGYSPSGYGVYGESPSGYAGYFSGDVHVTGTLTKSAGSFVIDHPLDPENKILRHMFVESPENLCVYRGKIALDASGEAVVTLPSYFAALTKEEDATVTLTSIGKPFITGYEWLAGNSAFKVYGEPRREISWVAYADRDDPAARKLTRPVEEDKGPNNKLCDRGRLLNP
jgi:hypothetical protein